ncbi:hypothetical protein V6N13_085991 [Hibiscus sabdariffa]|uniref:Uncharacterized protein n=1 Tax=Hibiscus sabdariffa TaxID=183260 RepID=A0ABR2FRY4_9ROSI
MTLFAGRIDSLHEGIICRQFYEVSPVIKNKLQIMDLNIDDLAAVSLYDKAHMRSTISEAFEKEIKDRCRFCPGLVNKSHYMSVLSIIDALLNARSKIFL